MQYFCLIILLLSCSLNCNGGDKDLQKENHQINEDLTGFEDPKEIVKIALNYDDSKRNRDSTRNEGSKKFYESKRYDNSKSVENSKMYDHSKRMDKSKRNDESIKEDSKNKKDIQLENYSDANRRNNFERNDYFDKEYGYIGNPDIFGKVERPCRVYDLNCIRKFFAEHSKCKIRRGPLPRTAFRPQLTHYIPIANASGTLNNVRVGGLRNSRIEEFYIDKVTDKLVFSVNIRNLSETVPSTYFQFYRSGREPIVTVPEVFLVFPSITFTSVIPNINDLRLDKIETVAFQDALPVFLLGPEVAFSTDSQVAQSLVQILADLPTMVSEFLVTDSFFYPLAYIQFNICDFGLLNP